MAQVSGVFTKTGPCVRCFARANPTDHSQHMCLLRDYYCSPPLTDEETEGSELVQDLRAEGERGTGLNPIPLTLQPGFRSESKMRPAVLSSGTTCLLPLYSVCPDLPFQANISHLSVQQLHTEHHGAQWLKQQTYHFSEIQDQGLGRLVSGEVSLPGLRTITFLVPLQVTFLPPAPSAPHL